MVWGRTSLFFFLHLPVTLMILEIAPPPSHEIAVLSEGLLVSKKTPLHEKELSEQTSFQSKEESLLLDSSLNLILKRVS